MLFASLQLRAVQATDARIEFQFRDYAGLRILMTGIAACVIFGIAGALYRGEMALTIAAFALSKSVESFSDIVYGLWQQRERMDLIAMSLMLRGVLALIAAALCFAVFHTFGLQSAGWRRRGLRCSPLLICGVGLRWRAKRAKRSCRGSGLRE
jgi:hypothetical protein